MSLVRLLLDAGNSRLKWAVVADGRWQANGVTEYTDLAPLAAWHAPQTCAYVASVANPENEERLRVWLETARIPVRWLVAEAAFDDVHNAYAPPEQLGVDRWMALLGARQRTRAPALVVSAGTALTVDALSAQGEFVGGLIVPGMALMRGALRQGTARVDAGEGTWRDFPRCTADAVETGITAALCGAIRLQQARLADQSNGVPHCFVTGGDAPRLLPHLGFAAEHVPGLVLEGIDRVVRKETAA